MRAPYLSHPVAIGIAIAYLLAPIDAFANERRSQRELSYCVYDIGSLTTPNFGSGTRAINNANQIVGWTSPVSDTGIVRSFIWDPRHGMRDLGTIPGHDVTVASDINDRGTVVGVSFLSLPPFGQRSFAWNSRNQIYELEIPLFPGANNAANGINNKGQVVGSVEGSFHGYLLNPNGEAIDLGMLPGSDAMGSPSDVNDAGVVVGGSATSEVDSNAFIWTRSGGLRLLTPLPDGWIATGASDINNRGQVVGPLQTPVGPDVYLWSRSEGLEALGFGRNGNFASINDAGQAVGSFLAPEMPGGSAGFLWDRINGFRDLNELRDVSSPVGSEIAIAFGSGINDAGWIAAIGQNQDLTEQYALVLVPRHFKTGRLGAGHAKPDRGCPDSPRQR